MVRRRWQGAGIAALLAVLVLAATATAASAVGFKGLALTPGPVVGLYGLEQPLVTGAGDQHFASIYENFIAYEDTAGGSGDIRYYNTKTNASYPVAVIAGSNQYRPRVWGNRIVWMDGRSLTNWDVWWYDIATKQQHQLTTNGQDQMWPEISGDRVVWQDRRSATNWDIWMYDFKTGKTTQVTTHIADQINPRISGNRIIWQDQRSGDWDIWWYDITTKQEHRLTNTAANEVEPDVWGTRAVWTTDAGGGANIDIQSSAYFDAGQVSIATYTWPGNQHRPRLYKDTMVWEDNSTGASEIYLYRYGPVGQGVQVTNSPGNAYEPLMWSDTIVWFDTRGGTRDIYAMRIPSPSLSVSAPSVVGYGSATKVTGYLKSWDGTPLSNRFVYVEYKLHSQLSSMFWDTLAPVKTNSLGMYTAYVPAQATRFYVRAYFDGDPDAFRRISSQRTVVPKVSLSKPVGNSTVSNTRSYTYYGYLKPKHTAGTQRVWIKCYRKVSGRYVLKKTYTTTLTDYSTYSKYSKKITLGTEGSWRIRAYYKSTLNNAETYSSYKYVTSN